MPAKTVRKITHGELDEYVELSVAVAMDPDGEPPARYYELLGRLARDEVAVAHRQNAPEYISIGLKGMAQLGAQIGVRNAL